MDESHSPQRERRAGIAFGLATHALFGVTVWHLFSFLSDGHAHAPVGPLWGNAILALQFALPHSLFLHPRGRKFFGRWIPQPLYGCFFTLMTCLSLLVVFAGWRSHPYVFWQLEGWASHAMTLGFGLSWLALFYSMSLTGLGFQTGLTPWWHWVRSRPLPRREFQPRSLYRWFRHPIYLSFLGLLWFTPTMTADRAVLTFVWTTYIFVGSYLKDERLVYYLGDAYREYRSRVRAYPFFPRWTGKSAEPRTIPIRQHLSQATPPSLTERQNAA